jgi:hypothetical protein
MNTKFKIAIGIAAIGSLSFVGSTSAAEMTGPQIKEFLSGKTIYLELNTAGSIVGVPGQSVLYFDPNGTALNKTPKGLWHGTWKIEGNTTCTDWKEMPNNPCTKYDKTGDTVTFINVATGQPRGKVTKTADGNAENLRP